jgi:hypothetical protein
MAYRESTESQERSRARGHRNGPRKSSRQSLSGDVRWSEISLFLPLSVGEEMIQRRPTERVKSQWCSSSHKTSVIT